MKTLVLGATGATGKHLVNQLLNMGSEVVAVVRSPDRVPDDWKNNGRVTLIEANIDEVSEDQMVKYLGECQAVASCLGHNVSFKGIYGKPRRLVTNAVKLVCSAIKRTDADQPITFILMNTVGYRNPDYDGPRAFKERVVIALLRLLLPPHPDN